MCTVDKVEGQYAIVTANRVGTHCTVGISKALQGVGVMRWPPSPKLRVIIYSAHSQAMGHVSERRSPVQVLSPAIVGCSRDLKKDWTRLAEGVLHPDGLQLDIYVFLS